MKYSLKDTVIIQIICVIFLIIFVYPLVLMVNKSFGIGGFSNYQKVFDYFNLFRNFATSLIVVGGTLLLVGLFCSLAAFAFSKIEFKGKKVLYYIVLSGLMIPTSALIFPLYQIIRMLGINNTPFSLIFPYVTLNCCFNLMVLKNYYDALPNSLIDAGEIDGASMWDIFRLIMLPLARPGLVFVLIQTFLSAWNELQMAMIFINDTDKQPLSVVPLRFMQTQSANGFTVNVMYAALVICLLPIAIFYVFASKNLVSGLTAGAVKG
jgi:raffinose/stachyose/melibiose transport system permease protein